VTLALNTAARQGELLALTWGDIDMKRKRITFRQTKNGEPRTIPMNRTARATLMTLDRGTPSRPEIFRNAAGQRLLKSGITWAWAKAIAKADLPGFRFHDLRHSAASFMVQAGVPLNTVRDVLGHKSIAMTLRYAHLAPEHHQDALDAATSGGGLRIL
jgi:integrase